ncbi:MAG: hypothetical protein RIM99_05655 [Cyclobacteriaceae bacterium]
MKGKLIFEETQTFRGTWMWYLIIGITFASISGAVFGLIMSDNPDDYVGLIIAVVVTVGIMILLSTATLQVTIDERAIYYKFPPFVNSEKKITKEDIEEMYIRKYKAIIEYGGYGYRFRFRSGRALNVAGNTGLQLVLKNGKKILIGTQRPDYMESAIRKLRENRVMNG